MSVFSERLGAARKWRGLTQGELAERAGLPPSMLSRFEAGKASPSLENFRRLAVALTVSADFLLDHSGDLAQLPNSGAMLRSADALLTAADQELVGAFEDLLRRRRKEQRV